MLFANGIRTGALPDEDADYGAQRTDLWQQQAEQRGREVFGNLHS